MSDDSIDKNPDEINAEASTGFPIEVSPDETRSRIDTIFDALAEQRQRDVLYYLLDRSSGTIDALARQIAARDAGVPVDSVSAEERDRVKVNLYHAHLPKLSDAGIIEYDRRSGAIRYREPPELLENCLQMCRSLEVRE